MKRDVLLKYLKGMMSEKRFRHTLGVAETAVKLAVLYGADRDKAETAGLLHDIARDLSTDRVLEVCKKHSIVPDEVEKKVPELLHGPAGACLAKELFDVSDREILDSITFHTTGRKNMTVLDKIIFIADMTEPGRDYPGVDLLRQESYRDLNSAVLAGLNSTILYVLGRDLLIHQASIEARNSLLVNR
ncbi:MAG: phosphohydrolase [Firmicutes bacterium HGW-Firmicutes-14]|nr:MAG: phosphohydrolase [Firmicutes bacterium HGW-Firmicutes-14]